MAIESLYRFEQKIQSLQKEGLYRTFVPISRQVGAYPAAIRFGKGEDRIVVWCTNDYLGMRQNTLAINAMVAATQELGVGSGGSRNISGTTPFHVELEQELASLHGKDAALLFTSGYVSNEASLTAIAQVLPDCVFISDELNHASLIHGIRNSRAEKIVFRHNDVEHLREVLKGISSDRPKIIVFESIYSMEGDIAPLSSIADVAGEYGAMTFLDEVHAVGMYGPQGAGLAAELGIAHRFDIIQGTLAKGFGSVGGYITGPAPVVDAIRSLGASFIFTTSLPPGNVAAALAAVRWLRHSDVERLAHRRKVKMLHEGLAEYNIPVVSRDTHIAPILIGDGDTCRTIAGRLLNEFGVYVQPVNFPSVPIGTARLRVTPTPLHSDEEVSRFIDALRMVIADELRLAA